MSTKRSIVVLTITTLAATVGLMAQTAGNITRPSDNEIKTFVKQVRENADKFVDALDGDTKDGTIRNAGGEIKVGRFLDDFRNDLKLIEERFKDDYAASTEVRDALRRGTEINTHIRAQPAARRGESEWNRLSDDLNKLAGYYGTNFPIPQDAPVRRMNDKELAGVLDGLAKQSDTLKKSVDDTLKLDKTVDVKTREQIVGTVDQLTKDTKTLKDKVSDGQTASAEAEKVVLQAQKVRDGLGARTYPAPVTTAWSAMASPLSTVARAFGRSW